MTKEEAADYIIASMMLFSGITKVPFPGIDALVMEPLAKWVTDLVEEPSFDEVKRKTEEAFRVYFSDRPDMLEPR